MSPRAVRTWRLIALVGLAILILAVREACAESAGEVEPDTPYLLIATVMGGVFALVNSAFKLIEKAITRRNGNGSSAGNGICLTDHRRIESQIEQTSSNLAQLLRYVDGFNRSHDTLRNSVAELVKAQTALDHRFDLFLVKFEDYLANGGRQ